MGTMWVVGSMYVLHIWVTPVQGAQSGGLSWLHVSFLLHVKYTTSCRVVSGAFAYGILGHW